MPITNEQNTDGEKRGKLILISAFISLSLFVTKLTQNTTQIIVSDVYLTAGIYFLIVFFGLIWAFDFKLKRRSFLLLAQAGLFVASQELFIEFFFFQKFSRVYEAFILLFLILMVFVINYFTFLSINVLNVNLFKEIPLAQVGRTGSFLISILMMYFYTFSLLLSGFPLYITLALVFILYFINTFMHYENLGIGGGEIFRKTLPIVLICYTLFVGVFLSGNSHETISLLPVVGYYFCVTLTTKEHLYNVEEEKKNFILAVIVLVIVFFFTLFANLLA